MSLRMKYIAFVLLCAVFAAGICSPSLAYTPESKWVVTIKSDPASPAAHAKPGDNVDIYILHSDDQIADRLLRDITVFATLQNKGAVSLIVTWQELEILRSHLNIQLFLKPSDKDD